MSSSPRPAVKLQQEITADPGAPPSPVAVPGTRDASAHSRSAAPDHGRLSPTRRGSSRASTSSSTRSIWILEPSSKCGNGTAAAAPDSPTAAAETAAARPGKSAGSSDGRGTRLRHVNVSARDGRLQLDPLNAKLYGGDYAGRIGIDATGGQARIGFDQSMNRVDLGALLGDFADLDNITGRLVTKLSGTATGSTDERSSAACPATSASTSVTALQGHGPLVRIPARN